MFYGMSMQAGGAPEAGGADSKHQQWKLLPQTLALSRALSENPFFAVTAQSVLSVPFLLLAAARGHRPSSVTCSIVQLDFCSPSGSRLVDPSARAVAAPRQEHQSAL